MSKRTRCFGWFVLLHFFSTGWLIVFGMFQASQSEEARMQDEYVASFSERAVDTLSAIFMWPLGPLMGRFPKWRPVIEWLPLILLVNSLLLGSVLLGLYTLMSKLKSQTEKRRA